MRKKNSTKITQLFNHLIEFFVEWINIDAYCNNNIKLITSAKQYLNNLTYDFLDQENIVLPMSYKVEIVE
jgi:hypothetical protein